MATLPEPWLRGPIPGVHPLTAPILHAFQQAREDLAHYTAGLTPEELWTAPAGGGSVGFHIRHIAGSTRRLFTYVQGRQLNAEQLARLAWETTPGASLRVLLDDLESALQEAEEVVRGIDPSTLAEPREVGRQKLTATVAGLLAHVAEHTQRHVGEAIVTARWVRAGKPRRNP